MAAKHVWTAFVPPVASFVAGGVLLWAAVHKLAMPDPAFRSLSWAFSDQAAGTLLVLLVCIEFALAISLLLVPGRRSTLGLAAVLFMVFVLWMIAQQVANAPVPCGCGMASSAVSNSVYHERALGIGRSSGLAAISMVGVFFASCKVRSP
ncbi:MAG: hypothetical protein RBS39_05760 [Phycisphaerales bacterium]|jgi:hypothetical protein|nr:hypothetical protein [Phycisphaerales bacterium]